MSEYTYLTKKTPLIYRLRTPLPSSDYFFLNYLWQPIKHMGTLSSQYPYAKIDLKYVQNNANSQQLKFSVENLDDPELSYFLAPFLEEIDESLRYLIEANFYPHRLIRSSNSQSGKIILSHPLPISAKHLLFFIEQALKKLRIAEVEAYQGYSYNLCLENDTAILTTCQNLTKQAWAERNQRSYQPEKDPTILSYQNSLIVNIIAAIEQLAQDYQGPPNPDITPKHLLFS